MDRHAHATLAGLLFALALAAAPAAAEMVSIRGATVNMRAGPGTHAKILWELGRHYPLRVLERRGGWLKIRDFEGDEGWVFARLTSRTPAMIVKRPSANIRGGPGTGYRILGRAEYGEVFRTLERRGRWVRVARPPGNRDGWIARSLLWGW